MEVFPLTGNSENNSGGSNLKALGWLCVVGLVGACAPAAAVSPPSPQSWSGRGIFVFGEILLDFQNRLERGAAPFDSILDDCSTPALFCARGETVRIAVPRSCDEVDGRTEWRAGGVRTVVLNEEEEPLTPHRQGTGRRLLLGDPDRPQVVYEYDPALGIISFYYDRVDHTDFVALARSGRLDEYRTAMMTRRPLPNYRHFLVTVDPFGRCESATSSAR